jgi:hypothetical protein
VHETEPTAPAPDTVRVVAWRDELLRVHGMLRAALALAQDELAAGAASDTVSRELLLHCHGFCVALDGHHTSEDRTLFPALVRQHPELRDTIRALERDHSMIAHLLGGLRDAVAGGSTAAELERHLEGIGAIMESHFRYEERQLLTILDTLGLDADPHEARGPL